MQSSCDEYIAATGVVQVSSHALSVAREYMTSVTVGSQLLFAGGSLDTAWTLPTDAIDGYEFGPFPTALPSSSAMPAPALSSTAVASPISSSAMPGPPPVGWFVEHLPVLPRFHVASAGLGMWALRMPL